jgi:UDP-GlcNAc3NAcA epimerase
LLKNETTGMKLVTIVGARPQFIKAAAVSRAIERHNKKLDGPGISEILVHTGQHYDYAMSQVFFEELEIRVPDHHLGVGSGTHGQMTGTMLEKIEEVLLKEKPGCVMVYGDTNSTLAGALAGVKLHIPVAHVEAGLRSFNRQMPEEINRVLTDHVSSLLFCPTGAAVTNLEREGITKGVFKVGDVMFDSFLFYQELAAKRSRILSELKLKARGYCLATVHREENTNDPEKLSGIFDAFKKLASPECPFIVPLHPRTSKALAEMGDRHSFGPAVRLLDPVSYLDMIQLEANGKVILTDSGGVQKEAYFAQVPCVTLRGETEWVELVEHGFNTLAGHEPGRIGKAFDAMVERSISLNADLYGDGKASEETVSILCGNYD